MRSSTAPSLLLSSEEQLVAAGRGPALILSQQGAACIYIGYREDGVQAVWVRLEASGPPDNARSYRLMQTIPKVSQ